MLTEFRVLKRVIFSWRQQAISGRGNTPEPPPGTIFARTDAAPGFLPRPAAAAGVRRSRRLDAKWISGILFTVLLFLLMVVLVLLRLTGQDQAEQTIAAMNRPIRAQQQLRADLPLLSPRFYEFINSAGYARSVYENPASLQEKIDTIPLTPAGQDAGPVPVSAAGGALAGSGSYLRATLGVYGSAVRVLGSGVHADAEGALFVLLALLLVTGSSLVFFSRGAGRIVSVGSSVAAASWAPLLALTLIRNSLQGWLDGTGAQAQGDMQRQILAESLRPLAAAALDQATMVFRFFSILAVLALLAAVIVFLGLRLRPGSGTANVE